MDIQQESPDVKLSPEQWAKVLQCIQERREAWKQDPELEEAEAEIAQALGYCV